MIKVATQLPFKRRRSSAPARLVRWACLCAAAFFVTSPLLAQQDPSGEWKALYHEDLGERRPGPDVADYLGVPINAAGRAKADAWTASLLELPENQCRPHPADYSWRGPFNMRIWAEVDRATQTVVAYHTHGQWQQPEQTFWMDGRARPSDYAPHTWQGFSTAAWEGNTLHVVTDHLREGWLRRNGLDRSDYATLSTHIMRHGNYLTVAVVVYDPVYLAAPFLRTTDFVLDVQQHIDPYPCEPQLEVYHEPGTVPAYAPGTNPFLTEWAQRWGIPPEATRGGPETMYPEYIKTMATMKRLPRPAVIHYGN
jgi:hypothetical protein